MSESNQAEISICLRDGTFHLRGSESFVAVQAEKLQPLIQASLLSGAHVETPAPTGGQNSTKAAPSAGKVGKLENYENLYAAEGGTLNILKTPSASSTSQKAQQLALLHTFGRLLQGQDVAQWDEVRAQCKAHGCLDATNFASQMAGIKEHLIIVKNGGARTLKLTVPGRKAAEALAESMNG